MKIVLRQDVPKLGESGSIQTVANGYARNYLIPQGMAVPATEGELKVAQHNLAVKERKVLRQEEQQKSLADRISGQRLTFVAKAGDTGRLFGSITAADVAAQLSSKVGEEIDRRKIVLEDALRTVGEHPVSVHLVGKLRPQITIVIEAENDGSTESPDEEAVEVVAAEIDGE
ncbi:MAG TPA: 50S ribosomal protein L9 [Thermomicrobiales bacterium]|nr:50S ribosomal protein L9 [Thermomicrobiales bacterium]